MLRAKLRLHVICSVAVLALAACGGGGGGGNSSASNSGGGGGTPPAPSEQEFITETDIPIPATTRTIVPSDPGGADLADVDAATYVIIMFFQNASTGRSFNSILGTGFAVGGDLIATNAHVSGEILNLSRQIFPLGWRITEVRAFRSQTRESVQLLEALVHPSYNNSTRSPDLGLFVASDPLPVALTLASDFEVTNIRAGDQMFLNGFPGDVFNTIFSRGFMPGSSIARATLFTGNIQSLQKFDERSVIDPNDPVGIDMIQHSMDTSGGTSGSPILINGKVVAIHNSGLQYSSVAVSSDGTPNRVQTDTIATASWGVHVKHLRNLLAEYRSGVLADEKRYRLPVENPLLSATGQSGSGGASLLAGRTITGTVQNPQSPLAMHTLQISIDNSLNVTGTSNWPANTDFPAGRQFSLSGSITADGALQMTDNTPEVIPGFRRGLYRGNVNPASGRVIGEYFEVDNENFRYYFSDWAGQLQ